ncbi:MAG TPA: hypothetical protein VGE04_17860 [Chloroflexia bacterium]
MLPLDESEDIGQPTVAVPNDIIATILDVAVKGWLYVLASGEITSKDDEPHIAGHLRRAMVSEKKRRKGLGEQLRFRIEDEVGTHSSSESTKPEGRIDIKIMYNWEEDEYFGIECKRVSGTDNTLAKNYILKGVMRFVEGKYSPGHDWGALIGFVIDGDIPSCLNLVHNELFKRRVMNRMEGDWQLETQFGGLINLHSSRHYYYSLGTMKKSLITLLHLFLPVSAP